MDMKNRRKVLQLAGTLMLLLIAVALWFAFDAFMEHLGPLGDAAVRTWFPKTLAVGGILFVVVFLLLLGKQRQIRELNRRVTALSATMEPKPATGGVPEDSVSSHPQNEA